MPVTKPHNSVLFGKLGSALWLCQKYISECQKIRTIHGLELQSQWIEQFFDFPNWLFSQQKSPFIKLPTQPWLPYSVVRRLYEITKPGMKVFEYGAGGSTLFFLNRGCTVVSVEHDQAWFDLVSEQVIQSKMNGWQGLLKVPDPISNDKDSATLDIHLSHHPEYKSLSFSEYSYAINFFPDEHFDIVLIDGRVRNACFQLAITKIKPGGVIIWDNVERERYKFNSILHDHHFRVEILGGATPGVNFFTWTAFIFKEPIRE